MKKRGIQKLKQYTVYLKKDDTIVMRGTSKECSEKLGYKNNGVFRNIVTRSMRYGSGKYEFLIEDGD